MDGITTTTTTNQQLALVGGGGGGVLTLVQPQQRVVPDMRTQRLDDFDIASNPELLEMFINVACHLNTLQYCHRGKHRFQVLTTPFIRDSFQAALACIPDTSPGQEGKFANASFSLDMWYFNQLPDEVKAKEDPTLNDIQNASSIDHTVDWFAALKRLQQRYPGLVHALNSSIQSQVKIVEKTQLSTNYALNYSRGLDPSSAPRMGDRILKSAPPPSGGSSGGHRVLY